MPKPALVVYYSRTGQTEMVARAVAEKIGADLEEIREPRQGRRGWWRSLIDVWRGHTPPIVPSTHRPEDYELVVVGSPVWASHMASPIFSWLRNQGGRLRKVAFFVTEGGRGGAKAIESMDALCDAKAAAKLEVTQRDLQSGSFRKKVDEFAARLST